jgi:hypothetical protein
MVGSPVLGLRLFLHQPLILNYPRFEGFKNLYMELFCSGFVFGFVAAVIVGAIILWLDPHLFDD